MTTTEMVRQFKLLADNTDSLSLDEFTPREILHYLNLGIEEFVKTRYREYELTQKRIDDLRTLVVNGNFVSLVSHYDSNYGGYSIPISDLQIVGKTYMFFLKDRFKLFDVACGRDITGYAKARQIDDIGELEKNPFNKSTVYEPNRYQTEDGFIVLFGKQLALADYSTQQYAITYLRYPAVVSLSPNVNCDLPDHTHTEIVNLAVRKALSTIEAYGREQLHINEINTQE